MVVYVGDDNEGVHNFEIANPGVDFDVLRGDSIAVEVLPARTVVIFSFSF